MTYTLNRKPVLPASATAGFAVIAEVLHVEGAEFTADCRRLAEPSVRGGVDRNETIHLGREALARIEARE